MGIDQKSFAPIGIPHDWDSARAAFSTIQTWTDRLRDLDDREFGEWIPIDRSGAGLVFALPLGRYFRLGNIVWVWGDVTYPATADGSNASIGDLPFQANAYVTGTCAVTSTIATSLQVVPTTKLLAPYVANTQQTNVQLTTSRLRFSGQYLL